MDISSEYSFPIFISSTDYNLIDLRAELAHHLKELGYCPKLSSSEGFPDNSPELEPWESCLPVLGSCFVMILIIDGKYGKILHWPHYEEFFGNRKLSPTHAEYLFAYKRKMRILIFIRKDVLVHYQSFLTALQANGNDTARTKDDLSKVLPETVKFETLEFVHEVKTQTPIPWITSFDDITSIKKEIQKKMLNELAEVFLIRDKHLQTIVHSFSKIMDELSPDKRKEILQSIGVTRELIDDAESNTKIIQNIKERDENLERQLKAAKLDIERGKKTEKEKEALEKKMVTLKEEKTKLEKQIAEYEQANTSIITGKPLTTSVYAAPLSSLGLYGISPDMEKIILNGSLTVDRKCDKCGKNIDGSTALSLSSDRTCTHCGKTLCIDCWPVMLSPFPIPLKCPLCGMG